MHRRATGNVLAAVLAAGFAAGLGACGGAGAGGKDPCVGVDCSGHGQCAVIGGAEAACVCDAGYEASGLACVAPGAGPTVPPGGASLGLTVPSPFVERLSPGGGYLDYVAMATTADPARFTLGHEKVRDLATGHEVDLGAATLHCGPGGCAIYGERLTFAEAPGVGRALVSQAGGAAIVDLITGDQTPIPLPAKQFVIGRMPDLSGVVSMKQTYGGHPGAVSYVDLGSGKVTQLAATANDPSSLGDVALAGEGSSGTVALHLYVSGGEELDLWAVPGLAETQVGPIHAVHLGLAPGRLVFVDCGTGSRCITGEVRSVPLSGAPVADSGGPGDWRDPSPSGTFVLVGHGQAWSVVRLDGTGRPQALPDPVSSVQWRDDASFYYLDGQGDLKRYDTGTGKATQVATGVARYQLLDQGLAMVQAPATTVTAQLQMDDGTLKEPLPLTPLTPATLLRDGKQTPLGTGNLADWQFAGGAVFRSHLYFDVLDGFAPGPDNGSVVFQP